MAWHLLSLCRAPLLLCLLALILSSLEFSTAAPTTPPSEASKASEVPNRSEVTYRSQQHRHNRALLMRYMRRIGAYVSTLVEENADSPPKVVRDTDAKKASARDHGTVTGEAGGLHVWMRDLSSVVENAGSTVSRQMKAAIHIVQLMLGLPLAEDEEEDALRALIGEPSLSEIEYAGAKGGQRKGYVESAIPYGKAQARSRTFTGANSASVLQATATVTSGVSEESAGAPRGRRRVDRRCAGGYLAVSMYALLKCTLPDRNSTTGTETRDIFAWQYADDVSTYAGKCVVSPEFADAQVCICGLDHIPMVSPGGVTYCQPRYLVVTPELASELVCKDTHAESLGLPASFPGEYCVRSTRKEELHLQVTWRYHFTSVDELQLGPEAANGLRFLDNEEEIALVVIGGAESVVEAGAGTTDGAGVTGVYSELQVNPLLFTYLLGPHAAAAKKEKARLFSDKSEEEEEEAETSGSSSDEAPSIEAPQAPYSGLSLTDRHGILVDGMQFTTVYCFSSPRLASWQRSTFAANYTQLLGGEDGVSTHTVTLDLAELPDALVEGGQMYVETGAFGTLVLHNARVARVHISFTDVLKPPPSTFNYSRAMSPFVVSLIALVVAVVSCVVLILGWKCCTAREEVESEDVAQVWRRREVKQRNRERQRERAAQ